MVQPVQGACCGTRWVSEGLRRQVLRLSVQLVGMVALACQLRREGGTGTEVEPSASAVVQAARPLLAPPSLQEILQAQPPTYDLGRAGQHYLVWSLDGSSFALSRSQETWLFDVSGRSHIATLPTTRVWPVKGQGYAGIDERDGRPTLWASDGRELGRMAVDSYVPAGPDAIQREFFVNPTGEVAVLGGPALPGGNYVTWDLVGRRVLPTLNEPHRDRCFFSASGRSLACETHGAAHARFVRETATGKQIPWPKALAGQRLVAPVAGRDGFIFSNGRFYTAWLLAPSRTQRLYTPRGIDSEAEFPVSDRGLSTLDGDTLLWNPSRGKVLIKVQDEVPEPSIRSDGRYWVSRRSKPSAGYSVRSLHDGGLVAELALGEVPLAFRSSSSELAVFSRPAGLFSMDLSTGQRREIAPAARALAVSSAGFDVRAGLFALGLDERIAITSLRSGRLLHHVPGGPFQWYGQSQLAVLELTAYSGCQVRLWSVSEAAATEQGKYRCPRRQRWRFGPEPGFLLRDGEATPAQRGTARQLGVGLDNARMWVTEARPFAALSAPGSWLSLRTRPKDMGHDSEQWLVLSGGRRVQLRGDAEFILHDPGGATKSVRCQSFEGARSAVAHAHGTELFPETFGSTRLNRNTQLLVSHNSRPALVDFRRGVCRRFPEAEAPLTTSSLRAEAAVLSASGAWLATLSPQGLLTLWNLEKGSASTPALPRPSGPRTLTASADDRFLALAEPDQVIVVDPTSGRWLRVRLVELGDELLPLYDAADHRYAGPELALEKVTLRLVNDEAPNLLGLPANRGRFGNDLIDPNLVTGFFGAIVH